MIAKNDISKSRKSFNQENHGSDNGLRSFDPTHRSSDPSRRSSNPTQRSFLLGLRSFDPTHRSSDPSRSAFLVGNQGKYHRKHTQIATHPNNIAPQCSDLHGRPCATTFAKSAIVATANAVPCVGADLRVCPFRHDVCPIRHAVRHISPRYSPILR